MTFHDWKHEYFIAGAKNLNVTELRQKIKENILFLRKKEDNNRKMDKGGKMFCVHPTYSHTN